MSGPGNGLVACPPVRSGLRRYTSGSLQQHGANDSSQLGERIYNADPRIDSTHEQEKRLAGGHAHGDSVWVRWMGVHRPQLGNSSVHLALAADALYELAARGHVR